MAITINIYYSGEKDNVRRFVEEMLGHGIVEKIRKEKGNLRYEYFFPMEQRNTVLLIDTWESQEALDKHHASAMMKEITELREKYDLHMKVERYLSDDITDENQDDEFIRK